MCYANVAEAVETYGGRIIYGWLLQAAKGYFVEAMHHAVWITPGRRLVDVTDPGYLEGIPLFVPFVFDTKQDYEGYPVVPGKYMPITSDPKVIKSIRQTEEAYKTYVAGALLKKAS